MNETIAAGTTISYKDALLSQIQTERDPNVLIKYVNMCYDVDVMRSAANRMYGLMYGDGKEWKSVKEGNRG